jgi:FlgD Ig-like domain/Calcineurin-like phosphoesterase
MIKRISFFSMLVLLAYTGHTQRIIFGELLSRPTDSSVTVQMFFADSVQVSADYGIVSGTYTGHTPWQTFADSTATAILISGLQPNTQYYYRLQYRLPGSTTPTQRPEFTFHTQRAPGSTFSFIVEADPHDDSNSDTALYRQCLLNQLSDNPDFMIDLGDYLMTDKLNNASHVVPYDTIPYRCKIFRDFYATSGHSVPLYNVLGNHEGEEGWYLNGTANNVAVWDAQVRKQYFINPEPDHFYTGDTINYQYIGHRQSYYAWQWGDALFIVLDPFWYTTPKPDSLTSWNWTLGKVQYDWLKSTLENSTASYKFVFSHQIVGGGVQGQGRGGVEYADLYEWGGNNLDGTPGFASHRPGWYKPIKDLLAEHRVNIFFHGHDHLFDQQQKDCMIYQETPQPSLPNYNNTSATAYGYVTGDIVNNSGHLRVTVAPSGLHVEYVRVYLPRDTNSTRHNKDVSASYFIGATNCYDSLSTGVATLWNANYADELVYPNPFMKQTTFEFSVEQLEHITLAIYDEQGKLIRTLMAGNLITPGKYDVIWDGNDDNGSAVSSGAYLYTIRGEHSGQRSGKMVLVR